MLMEGYSTHMVCSSLVYYKACSTSAEQACSTSQSLFVTISGLIWYRMIRVGQSCIPGLSSLPGSGQWTGNDLLFTSSSHIPLT